MSETGAGASGALLGCRSRWEADGSTVVAAQTDLRDRHGRRWIKGMAMTGRNPWAVLGVAEDAPYTEVERAFRRRVKQTHPDRGGDAGEFAAVVQAFAEVRRTLPPKEPRSPFRPTPYDAWLRPLRPTRSWAEGVRPLSVVPGPGSGHGAAPSSLGSDFATVLRHEMAKAGPVAIAH
jgi:hypothetical protein